MCFPQRGNKTTESITDVELRNVANPYNSIQFRVCGDQDFLKK